MKKWTRRAVIGAGSLVGGGLAIGIGEFLLAPNRLSIFSKDNTANPRLTTWIKIAPDNVVTIVIPHCEMGQGSQTGLAMMAAEELEADWDLVQIEEAPALDEFAAGYMVRGFGFGTLNVPRAALRGLNHLSYKIADWMHLQVTGGSASIRFTGEYGMRIAGASAKQMLLEAAAARWQVPMTECAAQSSRITHSISGKSATFGELASDAAQLDPPTHPALKAPQTFTLIGTSKPRLDIPSKVNGTATYGIDVKLPEMLYAAIKAAPIFGGKLVSVDRSVAEKMPGVVQVIELENAIAVVADGYWRAAQALKQLQPTFDDDGRGDESSATIYERFAAALAGGGDKIAARGNAVAASKSAAKNVEAEYRVPYLAHITMEPMNAVARLADAHCEVWAGVQDPLHAREVAAHAAELEAGAVTVHNQQLGGGFGRRLPGNLDYVDQTVRIAKKLSPKPVKLIWSREEDFRHDFYRQASIGRYRGALDESGRAQAWQADFVGSAGENAADVLYDIPNVSVRSHDAASHVRLGAWRSVDHTQHGFFTESFIDELAHAAGQDPFEYRRTLLANKPRHLAVLETAARKANWGATLAAGRARGIALVESFGTIVCEVAEVEVNAQSGAKKVIRVVAAVDCGAVVNPDSGSAQIEGGIVFGLAAALYGEIGIEKGAVIQSNFDNHPVARMADTPEIEVHFVASDAPRGGLGEPGVPPIAPAIANAIFAASGERIRTLPIFKTT